MSKPRVERWKYKDINDDDFDYISLQTTLSVVAAASIQECLVPEEYGEDATIREDSWGFEHPEGSQSPNQIQVVKKEKPWKLRTL